MATVPKTDWTDIPSLDPDAWIVSTRKVKKTDAIRVFSGKIRNSNVSGVFELENSMTDPTYIHSGKVKVDVKCLWYGCKPPTSWMALTIIGKFKILRNYSGPVVADIGQ